MNKIAFCELLSILKMHEINNNNNSHVLASIKIMTHLTYSDFFWNYQNGQGAIRKNIFIEQIINWLDAIIEDLSQDLSPYSSEYLEEWRLTEYRD